MNTFKRWNNITGWAVFAIALTVYWLTLEPSVSLWDCGEFIASSYKLEVGHPPGAPLFLLLAKVFSLLAPDKTKVALMINAFSGLASAFTILFLFWTITHFVRKIAVKNQVINPGKIILILGSGATGALAFTFSDTFWFSAVEAEVYALSSLFTAVVFWAMLKWEECDEECNPNRWLILIAYLMGLSVGVHLLNLLAIPAMALVFYYKKSERSKKGFLFALVAGFLILLIVQYIIIPGSVKLGAWFELLFVNEFGLPYNSGVIFYFTALVVGLFAALFITWKKGKNLAHTILLAVTVFLFGYSSYATIVIRSQANTPLNESDPENIFNLLSYLNREQYGARPLIYGQYYNAPYLYSRTGRATYIRQNNKYVVSYREPEYHYNPELTTLFPRMYSSNPAHVEVYKEWGTIKGNPVEVKINGVTQVINKPTFADNIEFFLKYQLGYMYFRYFMWNFAGRQNNFEGNGGLLYGNTITGIPFIDRIFYGSEKKLPDYLRKNKGRNTYFLLPLILGLVGLFYQAKKRGQDFWVVALLFFMTGIAIVIYLNQTPLQPRERDYAYVGSFYAFSVWVGLGVLGIFSLLQKILKEKQAAIVAIGLSLLAVPSVMAYQNWDDHDRSGRTIARDFAYNYLQSCAPNAILFTIGDNDTFPLWYLQEVEGVRTDVRVCNLALLDADWYINQMRRKVYDSEQLPFSLKPDQIRQGNRDYVYILGQNSDTIDLAKAIAFVAHDEKEYKYITHDSLVLDYFPARNFALVSNPGNLLASGAIKISNFDKVEPYIPINISRGYVSKNELMVLDLLANNHWQRPVYYTSPICNELFNMSDYLQDEGFAYRLVPIHTVPEHEFDHGRVETSILAKNLLKKFRWDKINSPKTLIDNYYRQTFDITRVKVNFADLAESFYNEGKKDSALFTIHRYFEIFPPSTAPHNVFSLRLAETCFNVDAIKEGDSIVQQYAKQCYQEIIYFDSLPGYLQPFVSWERNTSIETLRKLSDMARKYARTEIQSQIDTMLFTAEDK